MIFLSLSPQAMKVLSKKKLLKQYGFPRMYALTLGAPRLGTEEEGMVPNYFCLGVRVESRKQEQRPGDGLGLVNWNEISAS